MFSSMGKWHNLIGDNLWVVEGIVALPPVYMKANVNGLWVANIPKLKHLDALFPTISCPFGEDQVVVSTRGRWMNLRVIQKRSHNLGQICLAS